MTSLPPQTHGNNIAELVWTVVPTLIVAFLFVISWQTLNDVDAVSDTPETRIRAVAGQFQWKFDYLDETGEKVLYTQLLPDRRRAAACTSRPAGQIQLTLESPDVIHAFYVPQFLFKRDVVPGRVNTFDFNVDEDMAGQTFHGQCAELCGSGHRVMLFEVQALTAADFDAWLADKIAEASATPPPPPSRSPARPAPRRRPVRPARARSCRSARSTSRSSRPTCSVPATPRSRSSSTTRTPASRTTWTSTGRADRASRLPGRDLRRRRRKTYDVPALASRRLPLRVHGPSEHDRHPHGELRSIPWRPPRSTRLPPPTRARGRLYDWVTTTDHKKIGIMYVINSFLFFFLGGLLALGVRVELAQPGLQFVTDQTYNELFTMHATFMIFLFVIPMLAGFGNYVVPLQIGAPDMAFPRINALSFWMLPLAGILLLLSFVTGGTAAAGWTSYARCPRTGRWPPSGPGQDLWIVALVLIGTSSILGAINFLVTIFKMRAPGHDPVPDADHGLDGPRDVRAGADGHAGHHQRPDHAVHRPQLRRELLRPGQRRRPDPLPERLLVLLAPGRLRDDPAGDGHDQRDPAGVQPQAAVRLQGVRLRDRRHRRPRLLRVGPPHVHDRRGLPAVLQPHDVPDRHPDRREDVQLDLHDVARQADASRPRCCSRSGS